MTALTWVVFSLIFQIASSGFNKDVRYKRRNNDLSNSTPLIILSNLFKNKITKPTEKNYVHKTYYILFQYSWKFNFEKFCNVFYLNALFSLKTEEGGGMHYF